MTIDSTGDSTLTVAVTGHRLLPRSAIPRIRGAVRELVGCYPGSTWLTGGALGTDQIAAEEVLRLGQTLEVLLPFPMDIATSKWTPDQRDRLHDHLVRASSFTVMRFDYDVAGYFERNRLLVERADLLMAVWTGGVCGGTAFTVNEARQRGLPIYWVPVR